jgi:hypothetical protein
VVPGTNTPTDYNYFWRRRGAGGGNCSNISGAHALTYTLRAVDVGKTLRSRVVAKNADGQTTADSAPTDVVQKGTAPASDDNHALARWRLSGRGRLFSIRVNLHQ